MDNLSNKMVNVIFQEDFIFNLEIIKTTDIYWIRIMSDIYKHIICHNFYSLIFLFPIIMEDLLIRKLRHMGFTQMCFKEIAKNIP